jgi:hypothetical protein
MTENRTPIQISGNRVLCDDGTLWRWDDGDYMFGASSGWVKLPPIPTDEQYEILKKNRVEEEKECIRKLTEKGFVK